jgi:hypothetical protein
MPVFGPSGIIVAALGITVSDRGRGRELFGPVSVATRSLSRQRATSRGSDRSSRSSVATGGFDPSTAAAEALRSDVIA